MTITEVLDYYGGIPQVAKALGISYQAVNQWCDKGAIPEGRQWQLQALTNSALKVDQGHLAQIRTAAGVA